MSGASVTLHAGTASRRVHLDTYLDAHRQEAAMADANTWIKSLRTAQVDREPFRRRFTFRDDSLWWFTELYLHKQQVVLSIFRTISALEALREREQPSSLVIDGSPLVTEVAAQFARRHHLPFRGSPDRSAGGSLAVMDLRSRWLQAVALASRLRPLRQAPLPKPHRAAVLAFVHRAFWQAAADDSGGAEQYIGPTLAALSARLPADGLQFVTVGPSSNFRARRWWHPVVGGGAQAGATWPVEALASLRHLRPSRGVWAERHASRRAMWASSDLRAASEIRGCDCWPIIRRELAGVALLQWPWSARAMDEAGAALDALGPAAALTYAEAGGWGRAIVLECRRRGIPTAGLQHGFIYRHWLNYRHEADEMIPDPDHPADAGFPYPSRTLLFDAHAARHLTDEGRFPPQSLQVTGSPRLDELARVTQALTPADIERARAEAGASASEAVVLVATKWKEAQSVLPGFLLAAAAVPGIRLVIKTHPAETPDAYAAAAAGPRVTVLPASTPLAPLLAASRAIVTVNSTMALDAAVLGIPAVVIGLPNNLTPFVDAGILAGSDDERSAAEILRRILYDEGFRQRLGDARRGFLTRLQIRADGNAADRTAAAILQLVDHPSAVSWDADRSGR